MLSARRITDCTPRTKNGQPAHSTTGVANSNSIQLRMETDEMPAHVERHHWHRERTADPQAARHVGQFLVGAVLERGFGGLERHAADRAASRPDLADLGMHGQVKMVPGAAGAWVAASAGFR